MKSNSYELVSGSVFGIIAALQAIRAVLQVPGTGRCSSGAGLVLLGCGRCRRLPLHMGVPHGTPGEGVSAAIAHSLVFKVPPNELRILVARKPRQNPGLD